MTEWEIWAERVLASLPIRPSGLGVMMRAAWYRPYSPAFAGMTTKQFIERVDAEMAQINLRYMLSMLPEGAR